MNERELYQVILEKHPSIIEEIRADERTKTINEFMNKIFDIDNGCWRVFTRKEIEQIAEQMKGSVNNDTCI